jgi:hypothetical protein
VVDARPVSPLLFRLSRSQEGFAPSHPCIDLPSDGRLLQPELHVVFVGVCVCAVYVEI